MKEVLIGSSSITSTKSSSQTVIPKMVIEHLGEPVKGKKLNWYIKNEEIIIKIKEE